jgi:outer membrane protein assembly factor BamB
MEMMGRRYGKYEFLKELGHGGFGTVYLAQDVHDQDVVAVKILNPNLSGRPDFVARFEREAQLLRGLPKHPKIVALLDYGHLLELDNAPYLIMEYLPGNDLRKALGGGPLPVKKALHIAAQVADGLAAAADYQVVHCDIKPENIRLLKGDEIKVLDFGIASMADAGFRQIAGTPEYMAPEVWRGKPPEPATDIYALGCVLYEMLTGCQPFTSEISDEIAQLHMAMEPDWEHLQGEDVPAGLLAILRESLAKSPQERPLVGEVALRLRELAEVVTAGWALQAVGEAADEEVTLVRVTSDDVTLVHGEETLVRPPGIAQATPGVPSTPTAAVYPAFATGDQVYVQRHLKRIDMEADACRAALIHGDALFSGSVDGQVYRLDLKTGQFTHWGIFPKTKGGTKAWGFASYGDRLLVHAGDLEWVEMDAQRGQVLRRSKLPETGMGLVVSGLWLYMFGSQQVYRASLENPNQRDEFRPGARLTGVPYVAHGAIYIPTRNGLTRLDTGSGKTWIIGPEGSTYTARAVTPLGSERLVVVYSTVGSDDLQRTCVRVLNLNDGSTPGVASVEAPGQAAGGALVSGDRIFLAFRDGLVRAWNLAQKNGTWELERCWESAVGAKRGLQCNAALSGGLLALAPSKDNSGMLVVLNAITGATVYEAPLNGDIFTPPLWWQKNLGIIFASGAMDIFRIMLVKEDHQVL